MNMVIYYFSGTGNSLYVAQELQRRMPGTQLIPILGLLKKDNVKTHGETVGFVLPVHRMSVPIPVRKFLMNLDLSSAKYIFAILTHGGFPGPFLATSYIERILKKSNKCLDCFFYLSMVNNSPTGVMPAKMPGLKAITRVWSQQIVSENIAAIEKAVQTQLNLVEKMISHREKYPIQKSAGFLIRSFERINTFLTGIHTQIHFYTDSNCTGCGICETVCLSNKIKMIYDNPIWQKDVQCYYCYACFNFCPSQSILVKDSYTTQNGRYVHPGITASDISGQK